MAKVQTVTMYKHVSEKPTGLKLSRSGSSFTLEWKIGDKDYGGGQAAQFQTVRNGKGGSWNAISNVGKTTTKAAFSLSTSNYYPSSGKPKLNSVNVRIHGKRANYAKGSETIKPSVSEWSPASMKITVPSKPTLSVSPSETYGNVCTFSWNAPDTGTAWRTDVVWETVLVKNCNYTDGSKAPWKTGSLGYATGTGGGTGSQTITEDTSRLATGSFTRWFRVKARGPAGDSTANGKTYYAYRKRVYAYPYKAVYKSGKADPNSSNGYNVTVNWQAEQNASHPIEKVTVQYTITTPNANLACPAGASWTDVNVSKDTAKTDSASFVIDARCGADEVLFVRVNTSYGDNVTYGSPARIKVGTLTAPSDLSVSADDTTYRATVTATNNSAVPDSFLVVRYMTSKSPGGTDIGIIPHGQTSVQVQCPAWATGEAVRFGVRAVQGSYTAKLGADGVTRYAIKANMSSSQLETGGTIPAAPGDVTVAQADLPGTIRVTWSWKWASANAAELSWADHEDAWESTDEPSTYIVSGIRASQWNISGLETGVTWYVRVRLVSIVDDEETYGAYSDIYSVDLSSAPTIPALALSAGMIPVNGMVKASWVYITTDGTMQAAAQLAETDGSDITPLLQLTTEQSADIYADQMGWAAGETHQIMVRVKSASGKWSDDWSDPVSVIVADPITATISNTSLEPETIVIGTVSRNINALTELPLEVVVTGAGDDGTTTVVIERTADYRMRRPDESDAYGYDRETIAIVTQQGENPILIGPDNLIGRLDDGAPYRIIATVTDSLGQTDDAAVDFEVRWDHQAIIPDATVEVDDDALAAKLTPIAPEGALATDVCDIYRLSVDKPVLIYPGATFGETYVDPYPTIGEYGGHRFVMRTANGDYITEDETLAWIDTAEDEDDVLDIDANVIDFGTGRVILIYEIDLSNSWSKDFTETKYLGGSIQGDWNPAVSRTTTVSAVAVSADDQVTIESMRRLAEWAGICHVRTKDGSSFAADVQVSESYKQNNNQRLVSFSLKITRVDPEGYDGMTLAEWEATQEEEE